MGQYAFTLSEEPSMFHSVQHLFYQHSEWLFSMAGKVRERGHATEPNLSYKVSIFLYVRCHYSLLSSYLIFQHNVFCRTLVVYLHKEKNTYLRISINELYKLKLS